MSKVKWKQFSGPGYKWTIWLLRTTDEEKALQVTAYKNGTCRISAWNIPSNRSYLDERVKCDVEEAKRILVEKVRNKLIVQLNDLNEVI